MLMFYDFYKKTLYDFYEISLFFWNTTLLHLNLMKSHFYNSIKVSAIKFHRIFANYKYVVLKQFMYISLNGMHINISKAWSKIHTKVCIIRDLKGVNDIAINITFLPAVNTSSVNSSIH